MGDVVDLGRARALRRGEDELVLPGATVTWDAASRIIRLEHHGGHELDGPDATAIVTACLRWTGLVPDAPYGFVVQGIDDALGTVAYRQGMAGLAPSNREQRRTVFWGGTARSRFLAETYLRGNRFPGAVFAHEAEALAWLAEQGVG